MYAWHTTHVSQTDWHGDASGSCLCFGNFIYFVHMTSSSGEPYKSLLLICVGIARNTWNRFIKKHINKHPLSFCLFSDDRGEAMSSPSPGWQEAGAPCTGEPLFIPPTFSLFLPFPPPLSLHTLNSLEWGRSDVWHAEGLNKADQGKFGQQ